MERNEFESGGFRARRVKLQWRLLLEGSTLHPPMNFTNAPQDESNIAPHAAVPMRKASIIADTQASQFLRRSRKFTCESSPIFAPAAKNGTFTMYYACHDICILSQQFHCDSLKIGNTTRLKSSACHKKGCVHL